MNDLLKKYPQFSQLNNFEKLIFKTCFYFNNVEWKIFNLKYSGNKIFLDTKSKKNKKKSKIKRTKIDLNTLKRRYERVFGNDFLKKISGKRILDMGCGDGSYALMMAKFSDCKVNGVDLIGDFYEAEIYAKKNKIDNLYLANKNVSEISSNKYDIIISHDSFEHFDEPDKMFNEMVRVLKPGGYLWIQFGPAWFGPYGRHMSGTFRKDRPWVHLVLPEKTIMRCHSVLGNRDELVEKFKDKPGGLNKMGLYRFLRIIKKNNILIKNLKINPISEKLKILTYIPFMKELFIGSISTKLKKTSN